MINVDAAERIVLEQAGSFGHEEVELEAAVGRVLAEDVHADRDLPPYNRATMDGIAIKFADFAAGQRGFKIVAIQAAGDKPIKNLRAGQCVHIMTGAAVPAAADTVIPVEDISIKGGFAKLAAAEVQEDQCIHQKGSDKAAGDVVIAARQILSPAAVSIAASVGHKQLMVSRLPRTVVITTGNELVGVDEKPAAYQIRRSNNYAVQAVLAQYGAAADMLHLPDDRAVLQTELHRCLETYDAVIISGGVSKGKFDYLPEVLAGLSVKTLFHGVRQKPGKPFWFGVHSGGPVVFALPGNPVSTYLCLHKYFLPWLRACLGAPEPPASYAVLESTITAPGHLYYFLQAKLHTDTAGRLLATPIRSTGSADFASLLGADGFLELPPGKTVYEKGEVCKILATGSIL